MLRLRKFLIGAFVYIAASGALISLFAVPACISLVKAGVTHQQIWNPQGPSAPIGRTASVTGLALLFGMPPIVAFLYGMAWWKLRRGAPSGRRWAIAASCSILVQGIPFYLATGVLFFYVYTERWREFLVLDLVTLFIGIAGLLFFLPRNSAPAAVVSPRIAGDGTSNVFDVLVLVGSLIGYAYGYSRLERWGYNQGLEPAHGLLMWEQLFGAILICTVLHELGHASAAIALGMRLRAFIVGPFQFRLRGGKWKFKFVLSKILGGGGAMGAVPTDPKQPVWREVLMIAAGPLASLLTGVVALTAALTAGDQFYESYWEFLGIIGLLGTLSFVINLVPMRPEALYSDGARIYQLLSGGRWAKIHRVETFVQATLVTPLRPRDYDMEAIECAGREFTQGAPAVWLRMLATSHYIDCGDLALARQANAEAESIFLASQPDLNPAFCASLALEAVLLRRDATAARQWFERAAANKSIMSEYPTDYWLAQAALQWVENRTEEARASSKKAEEFSRTFPTTGAYNYDRHLCKLLGQAMEQAPGAAMDEAQEEAIAAQPPDEPLAASAMS
jgi:hypothetical protein